MDATICSAHDSARVSFSNVKRTSTKELQEFDVRIEATSIKCTIRVYGYMSDDLPEYFDELNRLIGTTGYIKDAHNWSSHEGELKLSSVSDSLGHLYTQFFVRSGVGDLDWSVKIGLSIEAGQLPKVCKDLRNVFSAGAA